MKTYMGIDQYGQTYHDMTHPRKDLIERIGSKHVDKMYVDKKDGSTVHHGYIIGQHWVSLYLVTPFEKVTP